MVKQDFSLYFHIPFCTQKCDYCHFYVIPDKPQFKDIYMRSLKKEWALRSAWIPQEGLQSIYFGGGTPALLGPEAIHEILSWISIPPECEITLEANPENVTVSGMEAFRQCGINRISLGVQTLDDSLLGILSRTHSAKKAISAVEQTEQAGVSNISIDLMYDLPGQTLESWQRTLDRAIILPIKHLSLYNLTIEPHTVFYKKRKQLILPDSHTSLEMLSCAVNSLEKAGLERYEISAFAPAGHISNHNVGYWTGRPFLGFGPSACSYWEGSRFRAVANLNRYAKILDEGGDPIDFRETLSPKEKLKEHLAVRLRLIKGLLSELLPVEFENGLTKLIEADLLENNGTHIRLTQKGLLFHDSVAEEIMTW